MLILVTGGTGVIGTATIPALWRAGHKIRLLSRHAEADVANFPEGVEAFSADIADADALASAISSCDVVLHIAGIAEEEPPEITFERINVEGTRNLVAAARTARRPFFIFVSSLGADRGSSDYHRSKAQAEDIVRGYEGDWTILRPSAVYGPGDETVSMLLKMVRTLPAVPMVSLGDQPFQPLWYTDLGKVVSRLVGRRDTAGQVLELGGPEVTTTDELLKRLTAITGRQVPRLTMPVWLTEVGIQALEAFGATGKKLLRQAGLTPPLSPAKLDMLLEGNVIPEGRRNALHVFVASPTSLDDGLRMLADLLPEQLPGDGVGAIHAATYSAEIRNSPRRAHELLDLVCDRINEVMPMEFAAEPGAPESATPNSTLTGAIGGRGNFQVRLDQRTENRATFVTLEGHPLAGVMQLHAEDLADAVRFSVHIASQPANVIDWLALRTIGGPMQRANWREVVRCVVELSGGSAPDGVKHEEHALSDREARDLRQFATGIVQQQRRAESVGAPR
jgi:NADH dehydrogenase